MHLQGLPAQVGHGGRFIYAVSLPQGSGLEMAGLQTKIPELFRSVELAQGLFLFVDHPSQAQDDGSFDAGYIDGEGFVKGHGPVLVLVGGGDGGRAARLDGFAGPGDAGTAAGRHHFKDGYGLFPLVGQGETAAEGAVIHTHVPEIVHQAVEFHHAGGILYGGLREGGRLGRSVICTALPTSENRGSKKGQKHDFHANKVTHSSF